MTTEHISLAIAYFQSQHNLTVDGKAGPFTVAALERFKDEVIDAPLEPAPGSDEYIIARLPRGKGMFIRSLLHTGTPEQMIQQMNQAGLDWVCILYVWQNADKDTTVYNKLDRLSLYSDALHKAGKTVWVWGWPTPGKEPEFVQHMMEAVDVAKASGLMVNAEKPYLGQPEAATTLMTALRPECRKRDVLVGLSSYGAAHMVRRLPWAEFAALSDFGSPQMYDPNNDQGTQWPQACWDTWKKHGFKHLIASSGCFNKTEAQMDTLLRNTPTEHGTLLWWDWVNADQDNLWGPVTRYDFSS